MEDNYYKQELAKERENQDIAFKTLMKLIAPSNEDQAIKLYVSIVYSAKREGWLQNEEINQALSVAN